MLRFSLFGFPVTVQWTFWLMALFISGGFRADPDIPALLLRVLAAFVSIIIHELGHAFMQRHYGARSQIVLYSFGGLAIADRIPSRGHGIVISFAGPLVQIACGLLVGQLLAHSQGDSWAVTTFLGSFAYVSVLWGLLNLVPIHPLDGGRILMGFLGPRLERVAYLVGTICAVGLAIGIGVMWQSPWNTLLMGALAWSNFQLYLGKQPPSAFTP